MCNPEKFTERYVIMLERISVIMGIYNCASTLPEAIESLLSQTYTAWKLIMCDDGSSDNTYTIAQQYKKKYPEKIIVIRNKKNMGLNYTLNKCLKYADTEYIARMDGDDLSLDSRFEKEITFLDTHPEYAIVSCPMIYFDEFGDFRTGNASGEPQLQNYVNETPFCHAPSMIRKEAFLAVNGYSVSKNRLRVEDRDLWLRMRIEGYRGFNLSEPLYKMRDDRNAYGRRKFKFRINEMLVGIAAVRGLKLSPVYYIYCIRPILVGMLPRPVYIYLHRKKIK